MNNQRDSTKDETEQIIELTLKEKIKNLGGIQINEYNDLEIDTACGIGGKLWRPSVVLSSFLVNPENKKYVNFENKKVVELGAGTGVCGLILATFNTNKVVITDRDPGCIEIIKSNLEFNSDKINIDKVEVMSLDWNLSEEISKLKGKFDIILGSDLIYSYSMIDGLIRGLETLCNDDTIILFSLANRGTTGGEYDKFVEALTAKGFIIQVIPDDLILEKYFNIYILLVKKCI